MQRKKIRVVIAGGLATIISYISFPLIYSILFEENYFHLSYITASFINITISHQIQRYFVYKSKINSLIVLFFLILVLYHVTH